MVENEKRYDYLVECFKSTREELLLRVKWRDNWLKIQLVIQVILVSLFSKIELFNFKADKEHPEFLLLAYPISSIICSLYFVEDNIIGRLSNYIAALSYAENQLFSKDSIILNWDGSHQQKTYLKKILPKRFITQLIAFILLPLFLTVTGYLNSINFEIWYTQSFWSHSLNSIFCAYIIYLIISGFNARKKMRNEKPQNVLIKLNK